MRTKVDLTKGSIVKGLIIVAIPILLSSFFEFTYNITDMFWLGRVDYVGFDSASAVAGVGIAGYLMWFGSAFLLLNKTGVSIKVAQSAGANDEENITNYAKSGLWAALTIGLCSTIIVLFFAEQFMGIFALDSEEAFKNGVDYLKIVAIGLPFFFINPVFSSIYNSLGKSYLSLIISGLGLLLNIILDPFLILTFKLGVSGAAIATIIAQFITSSVYIFSFIRKKSPVRLSFIRKGDYQKIKEIWRLGFPVALHTILFSTISMFVATQVSRFGTDAIVAQKVGNQIESLAWLVGGGLQVAIVAFVGQNFGAKKLNRVKEGCIKSSLICLGYGLLVSMFLGFGAEFIMRLFVPNAEGAIDKGIVYLQYLAIAESVNILETSSTGIFQGLGHTKLPSFISITGNLIRIPLIFILVPILGLEGIWLTIMISMLSKGGANAVALLIFYNRKMKLLTVEGI